MDNRICKTIVMVKYIMFTNHQILIPLHMSYNLYYVKYHNQITTGPINQSGRK